MASKEHTIKVHARRRFDERYGLTLTDALHQELVTRIQRGINATFIGVQSNRVTVWAVEIASQWLPAGIKALTIPIVYDKERKLLVTALPEVCLDVNKIGLYVD